ncbi:hypothetical protein [Qingshengfaniella alkalisoli]|uniref:Outer membrane protein beta-barrel domain-containing protein n=1 Tax=Qingshengfaniella alkalisoli TaxID=2599296 RepID=A0A5B8IT69_9RHOB|nr:hypothetical protein [Qingshengfaniella alkalisoli]QDY68824.1 hypothetical protein FPZ52_03720 [Qingshengfaniella alkalisoli]
MRYIPIAACLIALPFIASAGAWPRGAGHAFLSVAYEGTARKDALDQDRLQETEGEVETFSYSAIYGEFGVSDRVTLGIDIGTEGERFTQSNIVFASVSVGPADWRHQFALELGVGNREIPTFGLQRGETETVFRPGLSWGYGFDSRVGPGWAALDLRQEIRQTTDETALKADLTVGVTPDDKWQYFVQFQGNHYPHEDPKLRIVPTAVRHYTDWLALESALLVETHGGNQLGARIGLWFTF